MRPIDADVLIDIAEQQGHITVDDILNTPTIVSPPNLPLTVEELWAMSGEPVFICKKETRAGIQNEIKCWGIIDAENGWVRLKNGSVLHFVGQGGYGKWWVAYCRNPEKFSVAEEECVLKENVDDESSPLNAPLTMEELLGMDGEAVYLEDGHCYIVYKHFILPNSGYFEPCGVDRDGHRLTLDALAMFRVYRKKPEKTALV